MRAPAGEQRSRMPMKVSVVTAVYNRERTLGRALASLNGQEHPEVEQVLVDGGSTDRSLEVAAQHPAPEPQTRRTLSEPDEGIYDAINKGIGLATGDIVGLLHSDDELASPQTLVRVVEAMQDPGIDLVYGDLEFFAADDPVRVVRSWRSGPFQRSALRRGWMPPHPTVYVRRSVFDRFGLYDTSYRIAGDYDFLLRVLLDPSVGVAYVPEVLYRLGIGGASTGSLAGILRKTREDLRAARSHGLNPLLTIASKNLRKLHQLRYSRSA